MDKGNMLFQQVLLEAQSDPNILGFWLDGSRGKGVITDYSDYDGTLVVKDAVLEDYKKRYGKFGRPDIELNVITLDEFAKYASWESGEAWDRYNFTYVKALVDKTGGEIQKLIDEKGEIPPDKIRGYTKGCLDHYINQVYRSLKCFRDEKIIAAHFEAVESVQPLLSALFALHGRLRPYYKYLEWELKKLPLTKFPWKTGELLQKLIRIFKSADIVTQQGLLRIVEGIFRDEGYNDVFDEWGEKLSWMKDVRIVRARK